MATIRNPMSSPKKKPRIDRWWNGMPGILAKGGPSRKKTWANVIPPTIGMRYTQSIM